MGYFYTKLAWYKWGTEMKFSLRSLFAYMFLLGCGAKVLSNMVRTHDSSSWDDGIKASSQLTATLVFGANILYLNLSYIFGFVFALICQLCLWIIFLLFVIFCFHCIRDGFYLANYQLNITVYRWSAKIESWILK